MDYSNIIINIVSAIIGGGLFTFLLGLRKAIRQEEPLTEANAAEKISSVAASTVEAMFLPLQRQVTEQAQALSRMRERLRLQDEAVTQLKMNQRELLRLANKYRTGVILLNRQVLEISNGTIQPVFIIEKDTDEIHFTTSEWAVPGTYPDSEYHTKNVGGNVGLAPRRGEVKRLPAPKNGSARRRTPDRSSGTNGGSETCG